MVALYSLRLCLAVWVVGSFAWSSEANADSPSENLIVALWNLEWFFDDHTGDNVFEASLTGALTTAGWHTLRFEAASGKGRLTPYVIVKSLQL